MILIIGGAFQGKLACACDISGKKEGEAVIADGEIDSFDAAMQGEIVTHLHAYIRRCLKEGYGVERFLERLKAENPQAIVICNELGCGIVPVNPEDRRWREAVGDACRQLAETSDEVYRVVCQIPVKLKGGR